MYLRQNLSLRLLAQMFAVSRFTANDVITLVSVTHFDMANPVPRMWSRQDVTEEEIDLVFDGLTNAQGTFT